MEGQKRKRRGGDGELDGKRTRATEDDGGAKAAEEPEDEEVEEFFAILRRIRVAVEYFEKGSHGGGRRESTKKKTDSSSRRPIPSYERPDDLGDDAEGAGCEEEGDTGLDLNADPDSEPDLV